MSVSMTRCLAGCVGSSVVGGCDDPDVASVGAAVGRGVAAALGVAAGAVAAAVGAALDTEGVVPIGPPLPVHARHSTSTGAAPTKRETALSAVIYESRKSRTVVATSGDWAML